MNEREPETAAPSDGRSPVVRPGATEGRFPASSVPSPAVGPFHHRPGPLLRRASPLSGVSSRVALEHLSPRLSTV